MRLLCELFFFSVNFVQSTTLRIDLSFVQCISVVWVGLGVLVFNSVVIKKKKKKTVDVELILTTYTSLRVHLGILSPRDLLLSFNYKLFSVSKREKVEGEKKKLNFFTQNKYYLMTSCKWWITAQPLHLLQCIYTVCWNHRCPVYSCVKPLKLGQ